MGLIQLTLAFGLLVLWAVALRRRAGFAAPALAPATIKFTHVLPAILQVVLFTYWAMYSENVVEHLPIIAVQLVIAYAFDLLLAWTLRRPYSPSFAPVPIVLSVNLFVWFHDRDILLSALVVGLAIASRSMLRTAGRHIFNPSVFGVAVVGTLCMVLPGIFPYRDISHDLDAAPRMAELILLLALIPQIRLRTTPVALGAAVAMIGTMLIVFALTGYQGGPSPFWAPWLLAITLLAGDPATIPSGAPARLVFGLFLGVTFYVLSRALLFSVGTDFFSKVIPISFANLLVPRFEHLGERLSARWPRLSRGMVTHAYLAAWLYLAMFILFAGRRA